MARVAAWTALRSGSPTPLREVDRFAGELGLDERDTALARRLIGTEVRRRGSLRAITRAFADKKLAPDIAAHVHLGLVQLLWLDRIPDHAAVGETVAAVERTVGAGKARTVNAILRAVQRARRDGASGDPRRDLVGRSRYLDRPVFRDPAAHPFLWMEDALSIPAALAKRWTQRHGLERAHGLARAFLEEPPLVVRVVGGSAAEAAAELRALGLEPLPGRWPETLRLSSESTAALVASEPFRAGRLTVQGETAYAAARLVAAQTGERVLELCAAPGGKSAVLAEAGAMLVACDASPRRLSTAADTLRRLRLAARVQLVAMDGARGLRARAPLFHAALVDAPCTNTGVLGARPEARWRFGPQSLHELAALQARLLAEAAVLVATGGRLVYSVCSLEPEEGEQGTRAFLRAHPGWRLDAEEPFLPALEPGASADGGYAARLVRET